MLGLTVESLNCQNNLSSTAGTVREAEPEFVRALQLLREVQAEGVIGAPVLEAKDKGSTCVLFFRRENLTPETASKLDAIVFPNPAGIQVSDPAK